MKNNISLPYPVLGINDDVYPLLEDDCVQMSFSEDTISTYTFYISLSQHNSDITQLIESGKAEYACEVTCKNTYFRRCFHSSEPHFTLNVLRSEVSGRIMFSCFISIKESIKGYTSKYFHQDYQGFTFDLDQGDLLAVFPSASYNTDIKYDKLYAAGAFMQIVEASAEHENTWFNLDDNLILIEMPQDLFLKYQQVGNMFPEIIHSSLVHNALVYALCNLKDYAESGKAWSDSLLIRLQEPEFSKYDYETFSDNMIQAFEVADMLLKDPYKRLMDSLGVLNENLKSEEEE